MAAISSARASPGRHVRPGVAEVSLGVARRLGVPAILVGLVLLLGLRSVSTSGSRPSPSPTAIQSDGTPETVADLARVVATPTAVSDVLMPNLVTDPDQVFAIPDVPKPGYLEPLNDPTFHTRIVRIAGDPGTSFTALNGSGVWGADVRQHYTDDQPWNADGSLLMLQNLQGGKPSAVILDGNTYRPKYVLCSNYQNYDDRWHPSRAHKNERINVRGSTLEWFDIVRCVQTRVWSLPFRADGDLSQNPTADGRFVVLHDSTRMFVVDMDPQPPFASYASGNRRIGPVYNLSDCGLASGCKVSHPVSLSPDGKYIVVQYEGDHPRVFDVDPATLAIRPHPEPPDSPECSGHDPRLGYIFDLGHDAIATNPFDNDEPYLVGQNRSWCPQNVDGVALGQVVMVRLRDNHVVSLTHPPNEAQSYHISVLATLRPGWIYASYWPDSGKRYQDEIVAIKLDGSGAIQRFTHDHTDTTDCYRCESHPVPSRDGSRIIFASSWTVGCSDRCGSQDNPQAYVIDARKSGS